MQGNLNDLADLIYRTQYDLAVDQLDRRKRVPILGDNNSIILSSKPGTTIDSLQFSHYKLTQSPITGTEKYSGFIFVG